MFDPKGMALSLVIAQQQDAKDPLVPALIGGMLPFPLGAVAALLLSEPEKKAPVVTRGEQVPPPPPDPDETGKQLQEAMIALSSAKGARATASAASRLRVAYQHALTVRLSVGEAGKGLDERLSRAQELLLNAAPSPAPNGP